MLNWGLRRTNRLPRARDAPDSTAFTTRSRNSKEHGFGIDPPSRIRINAARFNYPSPVGESDSTHPKSALIARSPAAERMRRHGERRRDGPLGATP
jgi:hypothetical protein